jgi:hypothetical protein
MDMEPYPGYKVDPRVRTVIDRCLAIGMKDFYKPYSNTKTLFKFTTLERDLCIPAKLPKTMAEKRKGLIKTTQPGKMVLAGAQPPVKIKAKAKSKL